MSSKKSEKRPLGHRKANFNGPGSWRPDHQTTIFAPCTVRTDPERGTLMDATGSEVFECCVRGCGPKYDYCVDLCTNHLDKIFAHDLEASNFTYDDIMGRCLGNCRIMDVLCTQECRGLAPGFSLDNPYYNCAADNGCPRGLGQIPDKDCVEKNTDVIFNCCRSRCHPTAVTDCQELCETLQRTILDPKAAGMPDDMFPWARALQNRTKLPKGSEELNEVPKHISLENKKMQSENLAEENDVQRESVYPYLGIALGVGFVVAVCIIFGVYMYRKKHK